MDAVVEVVPVAKRSYVQQQKKPIQTPYLFPLTSPLSLSLSSPHFRSFPLFGLVPFANLDGNHWNSGISVISIVDVDP